MARADVGLPADALQDPVLGAAGDIACRFTDPAFHATLGAAGVCQMRATSNELLALHPSAIATLGDNQYDDASLAVFKASFDPTWGRVKAQIHPAEGNHEVQKDPKAGGYFGYFGAAAGNPGLGYYSYNIGTWHIVVLNSNCALIGGCGPGSPEEHWLSQDLFQHKTSCTLAYWHHPRWSSDPPVRRARQQPHDGHHLAGPLWRGRRCRPQRPRPRPRTLRSPGSLGPPRRRVRHPRVRERNRRRPFSSTSPSASPTPRFSARPSASSPSRATPPATSGAPSPRPARPSPTRYRDLPLGGQATTSAATCM